MEKKIGTKRESPGRREEVARLISRAPRGRTRLAKRHGEQRDARRSMNSGRGIGSGPRRFWIGQRPAFKIHRPVVFLSRQTSRRDRSPVLSQCPPCLIPFSRVYRRNVRLLSRALSDISSAMIPVLFPSVSSGSSRGILHA